MSAIKALYKLPDADNVVPKRKIKWKPISYICLAVVFIPIVAYFAFNGFPVVLSFVSMFTDMDANDITTMQWNNFENFKLVFSDTRFWGSWKTTLILATAQIVTLFIALVIAVLLEQKVKGAKVLQVIYFIPYICSGVAVAIMWMQVFDKDFGFLNAIIGKIDGEYINWLDDNENPMRLIFCVYVTIVWQAPAYGIVMFKAALKNVNPALYEAASLDGANGFYKFWHVTLPAIKSVLLFLLLASVTQGLAVFDSVLVLAPLDWTQVAGPNDVGLTVNYYIYLMGVYNDEMEYAAVMSWFMFAVTFLASFPIIKARNKASEG